MYIQEWRLALLVCVISMGLGGIIGAALGKAHPNPPSVQTLSLGSVTGDKLVKINPSWSFCVADYDGDGIPDLWVIRQSETGSHTTEVHILKGPKFEQFIAHQPTALHETPNTSTIESGKLLAEKPAQ